MLYGPHFSLTCLIAIMYSTCTALFLNNLDSYRIIAVIFETLLSIKYFCDNIQGRGADIRILGAPAFPAKIADLVQHGGGVDVIVPPKVPLCTPLITLDKEAVFLYCALLLDLLKEGVQEKLCYLLRFLQPIPRPVVVVCKYFKDGNNATYV